MPNNRLVKMETNNTGKTVRVWINNRKYDIGVNSFVRLYTLIMALPKKARMNFPEGTALYVGNEMIRWTPQYKGNKGGYWKAFYDISRTESTEYTYRNRERAFQYALKHYGWSHKQYDSAVDTYNECRYGYNYYPRD
jgi:hypothetical protein